MLDRTQGSLAGFELFETLGADCHIKIEKSCSWMRFPAGAQILDRMSSSTDVFFVVSGEVRVVNYSMSGREVTFASVPAGNYFGELAAIDGLPRTANVTATKESELAIMPGSLFVEYIKSDPNVAYTVIRRLAQIVRQCDDKIFDLSTLDAMRRVYSELLRLAQPDAAVHGQWIIRPYPPEREIATRVNTTRETVARAVGQLRRSGLVLRKERNLYIMDREALEQIVKSYDS